MLLLGSRGVSGSCFAADDVIARIPSYRGAGLIRKGPLCEACRAMVSAGQKWQEAAYICLHIRRDGDEKDGFSQI